MVYEIFVEKTIAIAGDPKVSDAIISQERAKFNERGYRILFLMESYKNQLAFYRFVKERGLQRETLRVNAHLLETHDNLTTALKDVREDHRLDQLLSLEIEEFRGREAVAQ